MKKRFLWLIPAGYFPYHVLLWVRLMRRGVFGVLYENAAPKVLGSFGVVYLTALIGVLAWTIGSAVAKDDPLLRVRTVRTLKLAQIPAYLLFLQACFIFPFSIMTIPISTFCIPLCLLAILLTVLVILVIVLVVPFIVYVERGQRRIPIQFAKRVQGRRIMGGQTTYLPIKVNTAGVVPIIFASAILYLPAQIAVFFPNVPWMQTFANAVSTGWINWILSIALIVAFAYFYTSMVFNPEETSDMLRKQGGFIPGVRPGSATVNYIRNTVNRITLPGALFMAAVAVIPSILFAFTSNALIQAFGGTSILIMVGVALDTMSQLESQLKMHDYDGFFD